MLETLGLELLFDLDLRLGEGTGACLGMSLFSRQSADGDGDVQRSGCLGAQPVTISLRPFIFAWQFLTASSEPGPS